jgi:hypothetical protein
MKKRLILAAAAFVAMCSVGVAQARDIGWSVSIDAAPVAAVVSNGHGYHGGGYGRERVYVPAPVVVLPPPQVVYQRPYVVAPRPWGYAPYGYAVSQPGYHGYGHRHHDEDRWRERGRGDRRDDHGYRGNDRRGDDRGYDRGGDRHRDDDQRSDQRRHWR